MSVGCFARWNTSFIERKILGIHYEELYTRRWPFMKAFVTYTSSQVSSYAAVLVCMSSDRAHYGMKQQQRH